MAYTGTEIFGQAISILDELSDSGAIVDSQVAEYKNRAPYLLDLWQHEMAKSGNLYAIEEYVNSDETTLYKWLKFAIPANLKSIKEIMFIDSDSQIGSIQYRRFGKDDIYLYFTQTGTARMLYIPVPAKITVLTQTLEVDDITATSGAYYLAEHFAMADQNSELAAKCSQKFRELKIDIMVKTPLAPSEIIDLYSIGQIK